MLKLGIIGTNWITDQFIEAAVATKHYRLHSVYSRTIEKAKVFDEKHGSKAHYFDDLATFLADERLEVVYIASPNGLHFEQARQAILHKKHIIVEKSAFSNPRELDEIIQLANKHHVFFFEAIRNIHDASFEAIEKIVAEKEIWGANINFAKYSSRMNAVLAGEEPNIFSLKFSGGALMDLGIYLIYPMVALFGLPKSVAYFPTLLPTGVDGNGSGVLKYEHFNISFFVGKNVTNVQGSEIYFSDGTLEIDEMGDVQEINLVNHKGEKANVPIQRFENPMISEAKTIASILLSPDKKESITAYEEYVELARNVHQVMYDLRKNAGIVFPSDEASV